MDVFRRFDAALHPPPIQTASAFSDEVRIIDVACQAQLSASVDSTSASTPEYPAKPGKQTSAGGPPALPACGAGTKSAGPAARGPAAGISGGSAATGAGRPATGAGIIARNAVTRISARITARAKAAQLCIATAAGRTADGP